MGPCRQWEGQSTYGVFNLGTFSSLLDLCILIMRMGALSLQMFCYRIGCCCEISKFVSAAKGGNAAADNSHGDDESGMQFIGFYSDYLVTDKVRVDSKQDASTGEKN